MWIATELHFRHYDADELNEEMIFMNHLYPGSEEKEHLELFSLSSSGFNIAEHSTEIVYMNNGFPVYPYLIDEDGKVVATPDEIGWFDHPKHETELQDFTVKEMNIVMRDFDGLIEILVDDDELEKGRILPIYEENLVILRGLLDDEDEDIEI